MLAVIYLSILDTYCTFVKCLLTLAGLSTDIVENLLTMAGVYSQVTDLWSLTGLWTLFYMDIHKMYWYSPKPADPSRSMDTFGMEEASVTNLQII